MSRSVYERWIDQRLTEFLRDRKGQEFKAGDFSNYLISRGVLFGMSACKARRILDEYVSEGVLDRRETDYIIKSRYTGRLVKSGRYTVLFVACAGLELGPVRPSATDRPRRP